MWRAPLRSLVPAWLACFASATPRVPAPLADEPPPDLLLVLLDDWSHADFEATRADGAAHNDLPVIESLAARGQSWQRFYTQPSCNPARRSLLFGRATGATHAGICRPPTEHTPAAGTPTVASLLRDRGYRTAAFGKWHVAAHPDPEAPRSRAPAAYGFDAWRAWNASNLRGSCGSKGYEDWLRVDDGVERRSTEYHTRAVAQAAADWWRASEGPRFAYVSFQAPHQPLHRPPDDLLPAGHPPTETRRELYEAMLVSVDTALGRLLEAVDPARTVVLVLADNGTEPAAALEEDRSRLKGSTFEGGIHVPLVVAGPGVTPGSPRALGHIVDLGATLLELAGASRAPDALPDSVSLAPVLRDPAAHVREHVVCAFVTPEAPTPRNRVPRARVDEVAILRLSGERLLKGRWVRRLDRRSLTRSFYDLSADPLEREPLSHEAPELEPLLALYQSLRAGDE